MFLSKDEGTDSGLSCGAVARCAGLRKALHLVPGAAGPVVSQPLLRPRAAPRATALLQILLLRVHSLTFTGLQFCLPGPGLHGSGGHPQVIPRPPLGKSLPKQARLALADSSSPALYLRVDFLIHSSPAPTSAPQFLFLAALKQTPYRMQSPPCSSWGPLPHEEPHTQRFL